MAALRQRRCGGAPGRTCSDDKRVHSHSAGSIVVVAAHLGVTMALNIKKATRKALEEWKRHRVAGPVSERRAAVLWFLKERVWTGVPRKEKGRVLSRDEEDAILGFGPTGVTPPLKYGDCRGPFDVPS